MATKNQQEAVPEIRLGTDYKYGPDNNVVILKAEWHCKQYGVICDLDLNAYCYDERARFIEQLDVSSKRTADGAVVLMADIEGQQTQVSNTYCELIKVDFRLVDPATTAILLVLDGGSKYFQLVSHLSLVCSPLAPGRSQLMPGQKAPLDLFSFTEKAKREFQSVALGIVYRDGWMEILPPKTDEDASGAGAAAETAAPAAPAAAAAAAATQSTAPAPAPSGLAASGAAPAVSDRPQWLMRALMSPLYVVAKKEKDEKCLSIVVGNVPSLEKFKPRLFGSVKDMCSALSSLALPKLKKKFIASPGGLSIDDFTEVIFRQLYETHPLICEPSEAGYTVAMIQEMFQQIDYNGDGGADWDEFTTFCIQTASKNDSAHSAPSLDEYVIEYNEDITLRETKSSAFRPAVSMRYFPGAKRFVVIPDEQDRVHIMDKRFRVRCILRTDNMIVKSKTGAKEAMKKAEEESAKVLIYDVVYLDGREMYAFSASDHAISICKEQGNSGSSSKKINILLYNKLYHVQLQTKLCWSKANSMLCSVGADRTIYGWDIDKSQPIFQVSRHSDIITDFIAADNLDCFITCSLDKRIVMWSAMTRRVKGIMVGHERGVRSLDYHETTLLSASFELDARTWDLNSKENVAILRGHRKPIVAAKLMCALAHVEKDHRAVTVDESGEMRLWNIFVAERASDPVLVPTLQIFSMLNPEYPMKYIKLLAVPYIGSLSQSYYSDVVGCSTRMMHFVPEKNVKEFIPPSSAAFSEPAAEYVVAVGKKLIKYDVCKGIYVGSFEPNPNTDLTALSLELPRCRRLFVGCSNGDIMIFAYDQGCILDSVNAHNKEVTCILIHNGADRNQVFSGSVDGRFVSTEEADGELHIHCTVDLVFGINEATGNPLGIVNLKVAREVNSVVLQSAGPKWAVYNMKTIKRRFVFLEASPVMAVEIFGCTGDAEDMERREAAGLGGKLSGGGGGGFKDESEFLTVAVALQVGIKIYTLDLHEERGVCTRFLVYDKPVYVTSMFLLKSPQGESVNYASMQKSSAKRPKLALTGCTDEGKIAVWEVEGVRFKSEKDLKRKFPLSAKQAKQAALAAKAQQQAHHAGRPGTGFDHPGTPQHPLHQALHDPAHPHPHPHQHHHHHHNDHINDHAERGPVRPLSPDSRPISPESAIEEGAAHTPHGQAPQAHPLDGGGSLSSSRVSSLAIETEYFFGPPVGRKVPQSIECSFVWAAHLDSICVACPLHEHGCVITGSHDGWKRVWNLDQDCLGELMLPNMTNKMKTPNKPIFATPRLWKFILEKMPVTEDHRAIASNLVAAVQQEEAEGANADKSPGDGSSDVDGDAEGKDGEGDEEEEEDPNLSDQERLRRYVLRAMVAPVKMPEDGPPLTIPSRADRKLEAVASALEEHSRKVEKEKRRLLRQTGHGASGLGLSSTRPSTANTQTSAGGGGEGGGAGGAFNLTEIDVGGGPTAAHSPLLKSAPGKLESFPLSPSPLQSPGNTRPNTATSRKSAGSKGGAAHKGASSSSSASLYYAAGENVTDKAFYVPPAFSEPSLVNGQNDRSLDEEGLLLLRKFAASTKEKIEQYEASGSTILLRSPSKSTSITLPELNSMRRAEISFGVQKDLYKNAEKVLNDRDNLNKMKMRDAITRSRIDFNVKKMGSLMMSVVTPASHDDVRIPNQQELWAEKQEKEAKEQFRMNVRLMQSSSLVPLEARERFGDKPLDRHALQRLAEKVAFAQDSDAEHDLKYMVRAKAKREILEPSAKEALLRKVRNAIRDEYLVRNKEEMALMGISAAQLLEEYNFPGDVPGSKHGAHSRQGHGHGPPSLKHGPGTPTHGTSASPLTAPPTAASVAAAAIAATGEGAGGVSPSREGSIAGSPREGHRRRVSTAFAADVKGGPGTPNSRQGPPSSASAAGAGGAGGGGEEESKEFLIATEQVFLPKGAEEGGAGEHSAPSSPAHGAHGARARTATSTAGASAHSSSSGLGNTTAPPSSAASPLLKPSTAIKPGTGASGVPTTPGTASSKSSHWLTTRMLLPYYKLDDVTHFLEIFAKVDENFSGDLDMEEWTGLFQGLSSNIPANEARSIFMKFKNENGFLTAKELVPIVFNRANKQQQKYIIAFCNEQIIRKSEGLVQLTFNEVEQLFEAFDTQNLGFVAVSYIREQIRNLPLPETMISSALLVFKNIDDTEMISPAEFNRFLRLYISKSELLAAKQAELKEKMRIN